MLYSCTNNPDLDKRIARDGRDAGVLVNIHDHPALCQFVSPAIYQNGHLRIAVSSNGTDVYGTIRTRDLIKNYFEKIRAI
jgi:siroheme synthase-like protein